MSLSTRNRTEEATAAARRALAMARRLTATPVPEILHYAHGGLFLDGPLDERLDLARDLTGSAQSRGHPEMEAHGHVWLVADLLVAGEVQEALRINERFMRLAESLRQPFFAWYARAQRSALETLRGHFDEAERFAGEATLAARGSLPSGAAEISEQGVTRFAVRLLRGDVEGLADWYMTVARAFEAASGSQTIFAMPTLVYAEEGRLQEAADNIAMLIEGGYLCRNDYMWCFGVAALAEASVLIDDRGWARDLYDTLLPHAGECVVLAEGGAWRGAATHFLGMLATMMCRWDDAERHFTHALAVHERAEAPPFIARTQYEWAKMLAARGEPVDRGRARALLAPALATARELGMAPLARGASELECSLSLEAHRGERSQHD